jgi:RimJ/RimL family protein N-acetyltransferase
MKELVTPRLLLRRYREADAPFLLDMYQRPEVLRFQPTARLDDLAAAAEVVADRKSLDADPVLGWWMVTLADGTQTGTILLVRQSRTPMDIEIGWHQHPDCNGNGYTTEAAQAVLDHALASGVDFVVALTLDDNRPSQQVCHRLGMQDLGMTDRYYDGAWLRHFQAATPGSRVP